MGADPDGLFGQIQRGIERSIGQVLASQRAALYFTAGDNRGSSLTPAAVTFRSAGTSVRKSSSLFDLLRAL
ncbi:hypothetical protein Cni_G21172 [Canna indica]|uniref:Uncharacterized protein n=1 Tax=Canna indica TaxID=4628 RepID=A0AAQ3QLG1_9LILI|nr:hypothetical protein Cni_G21172 [Canna indica]